MKKLLFSLATVVLVTGCTTSGTSTDGGATGNATASVYGKTFKGKWDDIAPTTIKLLNDKQLRYCFRRECTTANYKGNAERSFKFTWGTSKFSFRKTATGYSGTYRGADGNRSTVRLS